jgi:hypothetical protein
LQKSTLKEGRHGQLALRRKGPDWRSSLLFWDWVLQVMDAISRKTTEPLDSTIFRRRRKAEKKDSTRSLDG